MYSRNHGGPAVTRLASQAEDPGSMPGACSHISFIFSLYISIVFIIVRRMGTKNGDPVYLSELYSGHVKEPGWLWCNSKSLCIRILLLLILSWPRKDYCFFYPPEVGGLLRTHWNARILAPAHTNTNNPRPGPIGAVDVATLLLILLLLLTHTHTHTHTQRYILSLRRRRRRRRNTQKHRNPHNTQIVKLTL